MFMDLKQYFPDSFCVAYYTGLKIFVAFTQYVMAKRVHVSVKVSEGRTEAEHKDRE
jgi:hypothetical protein